MRETKRQRFFVPVSETFVLSAATVSLTALAGGFLLPLIQDTTARPWVEALEQGLVLSVMSFLIYGGLVYQIARVNQPKRFAVDRSASEAGSTCVLHTDQTHAVTMTVPSYREAARVIRRSLLSAVLQDSADRQVVLTIDDPEASPEASDLALLAVVRSQTEEVAERLRERSTHVSDALQAFLDRIANGPLDLSEESRRLALLYREAAVWFTEQGAHYPVLDNSDELFVETTFSQPARLYAEEAQAWVDDGAGSTWLTSQHFLEGYRRLSARFQPQATRSERTRAVSLPDEPNKTLCLDSYISLKGHQWRVVGADGVILLEPAGSADTDLAAADADWILGMDVNRTRLRWKPGIVRVGTVAPVGEKQKGSLSPGADKAGPKVARVFAHNQC